MFAQKIAALKAEEASLKSLPSRLWQRFLTSIRTKVSSIKFWISRL